MWVFECVNSAKRLILNCFELEKGNLMYIPVLIIIIKKLTDYKSRF